MSFVTIANVTIPRDATFLQLGARTIDDMSELARASELPNLTAASFGSSNLNDEGLGYLVRATTIDNLNLQDTHVSDDGLRHLKALPRLTHLRLKENDQLTNRCVPHLRALTSLIDLQLHETSVDQEGLDQLTSMTTLRDLIIDVWDGNYTFEGLRALSMRMPACTILAKGRGTFHGGVFEGRW